MPYVYVNKEINLKEFFQIEARLDKYAFWSKINKGKLKCMIAGNSKNTHFIKHFGNDVYLKVKTKTLKIPESDGNVLKFCSSTTKINSSKIKSMLSSFYIQQEHVFEIQSTNYPEIIYSFILGKCWESEKLSFERTDDCKYVLGELKKKKPLKYYFICMASSSAHRSSSNNTSNEKLFVNKKSNIYKSLLCKMDFYLKKESPAFFQGSNGS